MQTIENLHLIYNEEEPWMSHLVYKILTEEGDYVFISTEDFQQLSFPAIYLQNKILLKVPSVTINTDDYLLVYILL